MRSPRHPALRALWALGGGPAVTAARLERATPRLHELTRDYGALTLLSDRLLDGITRAIDLGAVARATEPLDRPAPPPDAPAVRAALPARPSPARPASPATAAPRTRVPRPRPAFDDDALAARAGGASGTPTLAPARTRSHATGGSDGSTRPPSWARALDDVERREPAITAAHATATMRERMSRAGHATAADTPVGGPATVSEIDALLAPANPGIAAPGARPGASATSRPAPVPPGDAAVAAPLARAVARVDAMRAQRATGNSVPAMGAPISSRLAPPLRDDGITESRPQAPEPVAGGFRGLAMRAAQHDRDRRPAPAPEAETTLSAIAVERMSDAELGRRITRLLQREARRHGIALGMVEP